MAKVVWSGEINDGPCSLPARAYVASRTLAARDDAPGEDLPEGLDIVHFIDPREVPAGQLADAFWIGPAGRRPQGFELLRLALQEMGRAAIVDLVLRGRRERGLLLPDEQFFMLRLLRSSAALQPPGELAAEPSAVDPRALAQLKRIVEERTARFVPGAEPHVRRPRCANVIVLAERRKARLSGQDGSQRG